jgi:hypothetical protein
MRSSVRSRCASAALAIIGCQAFCGTSIRAAEIDVTSCQTVVPVHTTGVVQSDLDCPGVFMAALENGATLDLNGHTVRGEVGANTARKAAVVGPGTLIGRITAAYDLRKLKVRDLDIVADGWGVFTNSGTVQIVDTTITGATFRAIHAPKVKLTRVDVSNNPVDQFAVFTEKIRGAGVIANGNGAPGCTSCFTLYAYGTAKFTDLQASGNTGFGVFGVTRLKLFDSNVTGNNGQGLGIDVAAGGNLIAINTTCGLSGHSEPPYSPGYWDVCTND